MTTEVQTLLAEIEKYCRNNGIAETTCGLQAVNDGKLCHRLRNGKSVTLATAQKIRAFLANTNTNSSQRSEQVSVSARSASAVRAPISRKPRPFRFYDNRQKYLAFINTCNEKWKIAERAANELRHITPQPPAFRLFDAGVGDGTVLSHLLRAMHRRFPTIPFLVVAKEISLEDVRLSLDKLPDRLVEHPSSVIVITNLYYSEAPWLMPRDVTKAAALNWHEISLEGASAHEYGEQLRGIDPLLVDGWQVRASEDTGNPLYTRPSVLVIYRRDNRFLLDSVIPHQGQVRGDYDLVLASQPWRNRMSAKFKVDKVLLPLIRSLREGGRLLGIQSFGQDPGEEIIKAMWPEESVARTDRHKLIQVLKETLGNESRGYSFSAGSDAKSVFKYQMHTLPEEIADSIGTSTLFAAWNAAIYVAQIDDQRVDEAMRGEAYLDATLDVLRERGGLWFNDESFVISRRRL